MRKARVNQPLPPRIDLSLIAGVMVGSAVAAAELTWPGAAAAIHDGVVFVGIVILSARRRDDRSESG